MDTVKEDAMFESDDVFHRLNLVTKAMNLIKGHSSARGACVIDIDAPWGMGKTTLLKMWKNELEKSDSSQHSAFNIQNECIYYNAWENDYNADAMTPLIYAICGSIYIKYNKTERWRTTFKEKMQTMITTATGAFASYLCYRNTGNELLAANVGCTTMAATDAAFHLLDGRESEEIGENYSKELEKRQAFHNAVSDLASTCGKLFIFVDELDRCKPTYAIQTLECIKHYFNIPNIVFVFATDLSQLAHTVETYYGHGMDAGGYFLKFFDYIMHLPVPHIRELMHYAYPTIEVNEEFYEYVNEIRTVFGLTPRETPWIIKRAEAVWKSGFAEHRRVNLSASYAFIMFLITVKTKQPNRFSMWLTDRDKFLDVIKPNEETFIGQCVKFLQSHLMTDIYALKKEISASDERYTRRQIDGATEKEIDYKDVFLHTTYAMCISQMSISQTVGEALLASLELS